MTETTDGPRDDGGDEDPVGAERLVSQRHYDPDDSGDVTAAIIGAVADAEDVEITAVTEPLLYDTIDAEALELSLFDSSDATSSGDPGEVQFDYHGYVITVGSDGWVKVYEASSN